MAKTGSYSEKDISYFKRDTDKIRAKPNMYVGPTDDHGIFTIAREPADNSVDEARAGRNSVIHFFVEKGVFWIVDEGVGIPVKKHPEAKISTLTHVLTALQSSGKMKGDAYESAIGTHGVGLKATNALSKEFKVWTFRKDAGGWHSTEFSRGVEKVKVAKSQSPKLPDGKRPKKGTVVRFVPDEKIFKSAKFQPKLLELWCEITSYMNAGLHVSLTVDGKKKEWYSKDGILSYLAKTLADLKAEPLNSKPFFYTSRSVELALSFADVEGSQVQFFTNTVRNVDEGIHAESMYKALTDSLKPFKGKLEYQPMDLRDGLVGIMNFKINAPSFSGQTKEKLVDDRVAAIAYPECLKAFNDYWAKNKGLAKQLVSRASELRKKTADFLKDKKLVKSVKDARKSLPAKLKDVNGNAPIEQRELFLVEGDSAGGTAAVARFKDFQATFALKGKPLNVMEAAKDKVNANAEIASIFAGIGLDLGAANPIDKIRFGRIIFLSDPDVDGSHINCLLMTLFWKYLPDLFKAGRIYLVSSPEFITIYKDKTYFGDTVKEVQKKCGSTKAHVRHIKGWGEIDGKDMRPLVFDKATRKLFRLMPPRDKAGIVNFQDLMGKDSAYRKKLIGVS